MSTATLTEKLITVYIKISKEK